MKTPGATAKPPIMKQMLHYKINKNAGGGGKAAQKGKEKMISERGMLTKELKEKAENYLGREFTQKELRLYPFIAYCVTNGGYIPQDKTDEEEQEMLRTLEKEGRLKREYPARFFPTREFWHFMNDCLADSYVLLAEDVE